MQTCIIMTIIGFLSGSVMYSYIIPRVLKKVDVRDKADDKNPGGANAMAATGVFIGLVCILLDILKAFAPVFLSVSYMGVSGMRLAPVMIAPVLGHAFSPFLWFKGGKALSVSFGSLLGIFWVSKVALILLIVIILIFKLLIVITPDSSMIVAAFVASAAVVFFMEPLMAVKVGMVLITLVVCLKHLLNPNARETAVSVWRYAVRYEDKGLKFGRK